MIKYIPGGYLLTGNLKSAKATILSPRPPVDPAIPMINLLRLFVFFFSKLFSQTGKLEIWIFWDLSKFQTEKMEQKVKSEIFMDFENSKSAMCQIYKLGKWSLKNRD